MARQTSAKVYNEIKNSGLLSKRRFEVYDALYKHGPLTSGEVFKKISDSKRSGIISQSRARLTELRNMGSAMEVGTRKCSVSGNEVILWDVTDKLPVELPKKKTKAQKKSLIFELLTELSRASKQKEKDIVYEIALKVEEL